jgi:hypothetical protein
MGWSDKAFVLYYSHATKRSREEARQSMERLAVEKLPDAGIAGKRTLGWLPSNLAVLVLAPVLHRLECPAID